MRKKGDPDVLDLLEAIHSAAQAGDSDGIRGRVAQG
jgi:hypothetical protein